ncbi:MAG: hypothetical protein FWE69_00520 [Clostridiales bacterium]|nr:hypothetical protein [Clostridiales bacterium]
METLALAFGLSLGLTLLIELGVALLWRVPRRDLWLVVLVNILTNPPVVLLAILSRDILRLSPLLCYPVLEGLAVWTEGAVYKRFSHIRRPYLFSLLANAVSFFIGFLLQRLF